MADTDRARWDSRFSEGDWRLEPFPLLVEHSALLSGGAALDLACGPGHNTVWLAELGYTSIGVDISRVGLVQAQALARARGVSDRTAFIEADFDSFRPAPGCCDLIIVLRFLHRPLFPALVRALRPGGLLFYATFNLRLEAIRQHPMRPFLLEPGELRGSFHMLEIICSSDSEGPHGELSVLIGRR